MGSARDHVPDPSWTLNGGRSLLSAGPLRPPVFPSDFRDTFVRQPESPGPRGEALASPPPSAVPSPVGRQPKLLERLREALRARHYSPRTEESYRYWVKRSIFFHNVRYPVEMAEPEINAFLNQIAVKERVSASTQNQALSALLFLYRHIVARPIGDLGEVVRMKKGTGHLFGTNLLIRWMWNFKSCPPHGA